MTVAPARPGPNLVRVDAPGRRTHRWHRREAGPRRHQSRTTLVAGPGPAAPRSDGLWAVVDLPEGTGTVLVTHGPRAPGAVRGRHRERAGRRRCGPAPTARSAWRRRPRPCWPVAAPPRRAPPTQLADADARRAARGRRHARRARASSSSRSSATTRPAAPRRTTSSASAAAGGRGTRWSTRARPGARNALLVVSGWDDAADDARRGQRRCRCAGSRSAPTAPGWPPGCSRPGCVDSTSGAVVPLDFDIRDAGRAGVQPDPGATYLPGQAPTGSALRGLARRAGRRRPPVRLLRRLAGRLPARPAGPRRHETEVAWFPGGTVTPIGLPPLALHCKKGTPCPSSNAPARVPSNGHAPPAPEAPPPQATVVLAGLPASRWSSAA